MASFHFHITSGKRGAGGRHADYVQRAGSYANYRGDEELEFTESINMPSWAAHLPTEFFRQADLNERANGSSYREFEFAIPREFDHDQRIAFVRDVVRQEIGDKHPCTWAIHRPTATLGGVEQPHAHVMFSERTLDGIERNPEQFFKRANTKDPAKGGCAKSSKFSGGMRAAERKDAINGVRERFATLQNEHLEKHGYKDRVTHKSLKDQGIERMPEKHLGPVDARIEATAAKASMLRMEKRLAKLTKMEVDAIDVPKSLAAARAGLEARNAAARAQALLLGQQQAAARDQVQAQTDARTKAHAEAHAESVRKAGLHQAEKKATGDRSREKATAEAKTAKPIEVVVQVEAPRDFWAEIIEEIKKLTNGIADIGSVVRKQAYGLVFAVNERYAAIHVGRTGVEILDREQTPVDLGYWSVEGSKIERKPLSIDTVRRVFGEDVLAQIKQAQTEGRDLNAGLTKGRER